MSNPLNHNINVNLDFHKMGFDFTLGVIQAIGVAVTIVAVGAAILLQVMRWLA
jgi:hypothetical protein